MFNFIKKKRKIKVFFLCQYKQGYNKIVDVIEKMKNDNSIDVKVLAIPDDITKFPRNDDFDFWYSKFGNITVNAIENNKWKKKKNEKPDYIFIQRPYDNYLPNEYQVPTLKEYSKICYIPYAFELISFRDVAMPDFFVKNMNIIFCTNSEEYNYCNNIMESANDGIERHAYDLGYPSLYNVVLKAKESNSAFSKIDNKVNFNIIWTPRWTTDDNLCKTSFFDYKDYFVEYVKKSKDINFVFRPHPLTFNNFIKEKLMTKKEVNEYLNNYKKFNMYYDLDSDYYDTFANSDILITDYSSVIIEYFMFNKPIIYCYRENEKETELFKNMKKSFYCVNSWDELKKVLEKLKKGIDPLKGKRKIVLTKLLKQYNEDVSLKIINELKNDYFKLKSI